MGLWPDNGHFFASGVNDNQTGTYHFMNGKDEHDIVPANTTYSWTLLVDFHVMGAGKNFGFDLVDVVLDDGGKVRGLPVKGYAFTAGAVACTGKIWQTEPSCDREGEICDDHNPCSQNTRCQQTAGGLRCRVGDINKDWNRKCSYCEDKRNCCGPNTCPVCVYDNVGQRWQEIISVGTCTQGRCDMRTNNCVGQCQPEVGCIPSQRSKCMQQFPWFRLM